MNMFTSRRGIGKYNSQDLFIKHYDLNRKDHHYLGISTLGELLIDK